MKYVLLVSALMMSVNVFAYKASATAIGDSAVIGTYVPSRAVGNNGPIDPDTGHGIAQNRLGANVVAWRADYASYGITQLQYNNLSAQHKAALNNLWSNKAAFQGYINQLGFGNQNNSLRAGTPGMAGRNRIERDDYNRDGKFRD